MFNRILMVCVGNICRSPTAEILLREALPLSGYTVSSAGIGALVDHPVERMAAAELTARGHTLPEHRARQLDREMLRRAELVLAMEKGHIEHILAMAPEARGKVFLLGKWQGDRCIADPYRKDQTAFATAYEQIAEGVTAWANNIHR